MFTIVVTMEIYKQLNYGLFSKAIFIRGCQWQAVACIKYNLFILTVYDLY